MIGRMILCIFALILSYQPASAQQVLSHPSIKGVNRVVLVIYYGGLTDKQWIRKVAEQELRRNGIEATEPSKVSGQPKLPTLSLDATLTCSGAACGYTTRLWLEEPVKLEREPNSLVKATTWSDGYENAISKANLASLPDLMSIDIKILIDLYAAEVSGKIQ